MVVSIARLPGLPVSLSCSLPRTRAEARARRSLVAAHRRSGVARFPGPGSDVTDSSFFWPPGNFLWGLMPTVFLLPF